jgi:dTDP-4-amino-4,6-dideoxy-D-galactose acyltransferase
MANELVHLQWDSEFLGYAVGRIEAGKGAEKQLPELLAQARDARYRLLYILVHPTDVASQEEAQRLGAVLVDRKVTFVQALGPARETVAEPDIREAHEMSCQLRSLALQSGEYSRFRRDANFDRHVFEQLYTKWIENSLTGELARSVLVFQPAETALGVLTLGLKQGRADIGMLAVDETARGARIGPRLITVAKQRARAWGVAEVQVVTQLENEGACRFYEKCGFQQERVDYIYHLWLTVK